MIVFLLSLYWKPHSASCLGISSCCTLSVIICMSDTHWSKKKMLASERVPLFSPWLCETINYAACNYKQWKINAMYAAFMKKIKILLFLSNINKSRALSQANIWDCVSEHSCSVCPDYYFLLEACVCSHIWNYTERYIYGSWHCKQDMGRSGILSGSDSGSDITQVVIPVSWGIVSHLPRRAVGINLGLPAFWMCCHPHMQDVDFHLWADRWVESRPCWAEQR